MSPEDSQHADFEPGTIIPGPSRISYEILGVAGAGTFGTVYKCRSSNGNLVALKSIRSHGSSMTAGLREAALLRRVQESSAFPRIFDAFALQKHFFIAIEMLGYNLFEVLKIGGFAGFSHTVLRRVSQQLVDALAFLHARNIVHCDLKPENILVSDPETVSIKIVDLGNAQEEKSTCYYVQSRYYRAPEVILGLPYDSSVDVWSFGCVIYELFAGSPLIPGKDNSEMAARMTALFGDFPRWMIEHGVNSHLFFDRVVLEDRETGIREPLSNTERLCRKPRNHIGVAEDSRLENNQDSDNDIELSQIPFSSTVYPEKLPLKLRNFKTEYDSQHVHTSSRRSDSLGGGQRQEYLSNPHHPKSQRAHASFEGLDFFSGTQRQEYTSNYNQPQSTNRGIRGNNPSNIREPSGSSYRHDSRVWNSPQYPNSHHLRDSEGLIEQPESANIYATSGPNNPTYRENGGSYPEEYGGVVHYCHDDHVKKPAQGCAVRNLSNFNCRLPDRNIHGMVCRDASSRTGHAKTPNRGFYPIESAEYIERYRDLRCESKSYAKIRTTAQKPTKNRVYASPYRSPRNFPHFEDSVVQIPNDKKVYNRSHQDAGHFQISVYPLSKEYSHSKSPRINRHTSDIKSRESCSFDVKDHYRINSRGISLLEFNETDQDFSRSTSENRPAIKIPCSMPRESVEDQFGFEYRYLTGKNTERYLESESTRRASLTHVSEHQRAYDIETESIRSPNLPDALKLNKSPVYSHNDSRLFCNERLNTRLGTNSAKDIPEASAPIISVNSCFDRMSLYPRKADRNSALRYKPIDQKAHIVDSTQSIEHRAWRCVESYRNPTNTDLKYEGTSMGNSDRPHPYSYEETILPIHKPPFHQYKSHNTRHLRENNQYIRSDKRFFSDPDRILEDINTVDNEIPPTVSSQGRIGHGYPYGECLSAENSPNGGLSKYSCDRNDRLSRNSSSVRSISPKNSYVTKPTKIPLDRSPMDYMRSSRKLYQGSDTSNNTNLQTSDAMLHASNFQNTPRLLCENFTHSPFDEHQGSADKRISHLEKGRLSRLDRPRMITDPGSIPEYSTSSHTLPPCEEFSEVHEHRKKYRPDSTPHRDKPNILEHRRSTHNPRRLSQNVPSDSDHTEIPHIFTKHTNLPKDYRKPTRATTEDLNAAHILRQMQDDVSDSFGSGVFQETLRYDDLDTPGNLDLISNDHKALYRSHWRADFTNSANNRYHRSQSPNLSLQDKSEETGSDDIDQNHLSHNRSSKSVEDSQPYQLSTDLTQMIQSKSPQFSESQVYYAKRVFSNDTQQLHYPEMNDSISYRKKQLNEITKSRDSRALFDPKNTSWSENQDLNRFYDSSSSVEEGRHPSSSSIDLPYSPNTNQRFKTDDRFREDPRIALNRESYRNNTLINYFFVLKNQADVQKYPDARHLHDRIMQDDGEHNDNALLLDFIIDTLNINHLDRPTIFHLRSHPYLQLRTLNKSFEFYPPDNCQIGQREINNPKHSKKVDRRYSIHYSIQEKGHGLTNRKNSAYNSHHRHINFK